MAKKVKFESVTLLPEDIKTALVFLNEIREQLIPGSASCGAEGVSRRIALYTLNRLEDRLNGK